MRNNKYLLFLLCFMLHFGVFAQNGVDFSEREAKLIFEKDSSEAMRVWKITNKEDSIFLRQKCEKVAINPNDTTLVYFVNRLYRTVRHPSSLGVGIAAPQVGINKRIIWVKRVDKEEEGMPFKVYINPKILEYSKETKITPEGCLSIPDRRENIIRPDKIKIQYQSLDGEIHEEEIDGFTSVIFQHEIDHLDGILYLDHLESED